MNENCIPTPSKEVMQYFADAQVCSMFRTKIDNSEKNCTELLIIGTKFLGKASSNLLEWI